MKTGMIMMIPKLIAAIEASLVNQRMKNVEPPEKEVDDVIRKFISDNLQTAGEDDFVNLLISKKISRKVDCMVHSSKWIRTQVFVTRSFLGDELCASRT